MFHKAHTHSATVHNCGCAPENVLSVHSTLTKFNIDGAKVIFNVHRNMYVTSLDALAL